MRVNLKGVFLGCKHGIPALLRAGGGSIVNTASFVAVLGAATSQIAYTASKGGVLAMTREIAVEYAPAVGVGNGLADLLEDLEVPFEIVLRVRATLENDCQRLTADQAHAEERAAVLAHAQVVLGTALQGQQVATRQRQVFVDPQPVRDLEHL